MTEVIVFICIVAIILFIGFFIIYPEEMKKKKGIVTVEMREEDIKLINAVKSLIESDYSFEEIMHYIEKMKK